MLYYKKNPYVFGYFAVNMSKLVTLLLTRLFQLRCSPRCIPMYLIQHCTFNIMNVHMDLFFAKLGVFSVIFTDNMFVAK